MVKSKALEIGGVKFNAEYLKTVSEEKAVSDYKHLKASKVRNAWKQANGKTVRNYSKGEEKTGKAKAKTSVKTKAKKEKNKD